MFDGISNRSHVSMGGAGRGRHRPGGESKSEFLKRQHKERDERERKRLEQSSAMKIQATYRGWRSRKTHGDAQRAIFDKRCSDIAKVQQMLPQEQLAAFIYQALVSVSLLRVFVFFFSERYDRGRLAKVLELLFFSGSRPAASQNLFHLALADEPQRRSFLVLFERLLTAVLRCEQARDAARLLQLLWAVLGSTEEEKSGMVASHVLRRTSALSVISREGMFFETAAADSSMSAIDLVLFSCSGIAASPMPQRVHLQALLLSSPCVWERLANDPPEGVPHKCLQRVADVLSFAPDGENSPGLLASLGADAQGQPRWAWLLGNLATFVGRMLEAPMTYLCKVPIWLAWISWCKENAPSAARGEAFALQLQRAHGATLARALLRHVDTGDSQQLLRAMLYLYFPVAGSGGGEASAVETPTDVLQVLAFGTPLTERLLPCIAAWAKTPDMDVLGNADLALYLRAFCSVYTMQLQSMYDAEFFGPANPVRPHEVALIVPALNRLAYTLVTQQAARRKEVARGLAEPFSLSTQLLGKAVTGLVRALYHRHLRKPILDEAAATSFQIPEARNLLRSAPVVDLGKDEAPPSDPMDADDDDAMEDVSPGGAPPSARPALPARLPARLGGDSSAREILESVLDELPHVLPFQDRVALLHNVTMLDQENREDTRAPRPGMMQHQIRRNFLAEDGFAAFQNLEDEDSLRGVFKVEFIGTDGEPETGIDGGGLFKEFMIHICRESFDPKYGLFAVTDEQSLYPSPSAFRAHPNAAELYRFLGKVVGKAIYERFLLEAQFSRVFLNRILGRTNEVDDVAALDKEVHRGMLRLKEVERVEDLGLTFSISTSSLGQTEDVNLIPNGRNIPVTRDNLTQYLHVVANFRTNLQIKRHTDAFVQGIQCVIPLAWLKMFDPYELNTLVSGSCVGFDVSDLYRHTVYGPGYNEKSPTIQWFWQLLQELDADDLGRFLMFATSCSRPPLLGFKTLYPQFCIHLVPDSSRLPTAATCANLLKLPNYRTYEDLKRKVTQAIRAECGFDLS